MIGKTMGIEIRLAETPNPKNSLKVVLVLLLLVLLHSFLFSMQTEDELYWSEIMILEVDIIETAAYQDPILIFLYEDKFGIRVAGDIFYESKFDEKVYLRSNLERSMETIIAFQGYTWGELIKEHDRFLMVFTEFNKQNSLFLQELDKSSWNPRAVSPFDSLSMEDVIARLDSSSIIKVWELDWKQYLENNGKFEFP